MKLISNSSQAGSKLKSIVQEVLENTILYYKATRTGPWQLGKNVQLIRRKHLGQDCTTLREQIHRQSKEFPQQKSQELLSPKQPMRELDQGLTTNLTLQLAPCTLFKSVMKWKWTTEHQVPATTSRISLTPQVSYHHPRRTCYQPAARELQTPPKLRISHLWRVNKISTRSCSQPMGYCPVAREDQRESRVELRRTPPHRWRKQLKNKPSTNTSFRTPHRLRNQVPTLYLIIGSRFRQRSSASE